MQRGGFPFLFSPWEKTASKTSLSSELKTHAREGKCNDGCKTRSTDISVCLFSLSSPSLSLSHTHTREFKNSNLGPQLSECWVPRGDGEAKRVLGWPASPEESAVPDSVRPSLKIQSEDMTRCWPLPSTHMWTHSTRTHPGKRIYSDVDSQLLKNTGRNKVYESISWCTTVPAPFWSEGL